MRGWARAGFDRLRAKACLAAVLVLLLAAAAPVPAREAEERQGAAMAEAVLGQLAAFRRGDWEAAYGFASTTIRTQFTLEGFREMVTRGYAQIARPARSTVLGTHVLDAGRGYVEVRVHGQDGQVVDALYELVGEDGAWKVNGVITKPGPRGEFMRRAPSAPEDESPPDGRASQGS